MICDIYIYCLYHTKVFSLIVFPFPSSASVKISEIPAALYPVLMTPFPFLNLGC